MPLGDTREGVRNRVTSAHDNLEWHDEGDRGDAEVPNFAASKWAFIINLWGAKAMVEGSNKEGPFVHSCLVEYRTKVTNLTVIDHRSSIVGHLPSLQPKPI